MLLYISDCEEPDAQDQDGSQSNNTANNGVQDSVMYIQFAAVFNKGAIFNHSKILH